MSIQLEANTCMVSVCMITYNHEEFVAEAIEGVLMQQTDFDYQLIIGEDCSTDDTRKICETYLEKYPNRIELLPSEKNLGMMPNFIRTLNTCTGKYIALCEGDDYWTDPLKLRKQVDFLEGNQNFTICFHQSKQLFDNGDIADFNNYKEDKTFTLQDIITNNTISTASCVFRNHHLHFPKWYFQSPAGDWALHILNAQFGDIYYMNDSMSIYRIHKNGIWIGLDDKQRLQNGIKVLKIINRGLGYKYNEWFQEAIRLRKNRILTYNSKGKKNNTLWWKFKNRLNGTYQKIKHA